MGWLLLFSSCGKMRWDEVHEHKEYTIARCYVRYGRSGMEYGWEYNTKLEEQSRLLFACGFLLLLLASRWTLTACFGWLVWWLRVHGISEYFVVHLSHSEADAHNEAGEVNVLVILKAFWSRQKRRRSPKVKTPISTLFTRSTSLPYYSISNRRRNKHTPIPGGSTDLLSTPFNITI